MEKNRPAGQKERRSTASAAGLRLTLTVLHAKNPAKKGQNALDTADMVITALNRCRVPAQVISAKDFFMDKRHFLTASLAGAVSMPPWAGAQGSRRALSGPALLTVSGQIGAGNRGPLNPALDRMMAKQKIMFDRAHAFDFAALTAMPAVTIQPTLEYDGMPHVFKGPLLLDVMKACGVKVSEKTVLFVRAVDGYAAQVTAAEVEKYRFIVATHIDGQPIALGGLGPLWALYDADRFPDMAAKPLSGRFTNCPWATYHIDVREG